MRLIRWTLPKDFSEDFLKFHSGVSVPLSKGMHLLFNNEMTLQEFVIPFTFYNAD